MPGAVTPSSTISAAGSHSGTPPHKRFSTVNSRGMYSDKSASSAATTTTSNVRGSVKNLFGNDASIEATAAAAAAATSPSGIASASNGGASGREEGPWSISVAEAVPTTLSTRSNKLQSKRTAGGAVGGSSSSSGAPRPGATSYNLYVTTPTHNLTLVRSANEIFELDTKLRESTIFSAARPLPRLPALGRGLTEAAAGDAGRGAERDGVQQAASTTTTSKSRLLQTISRTLSPGASKNRDRTGLGQAGLFGASESAKTSSSPGATSKGPASPPSVAIANPLPLPEDAVFTPSDSSHSTITKLATYLTSMANHATVRQHKYWRRFIHVRADDLESVRVERRVRKVRSDLAQHLKSSVAPTNTNVAGNASSSPRPSNSDREADSIDRSMDEGDQQRRSPVATKRKQVTKGAQPDVPARSTSASVDAETTARARESSTEVPVHPLQAGLARRKSKKTTAGGTANHSAERSSSTIASEGKQRAETVAAAGPVANVLEEEASATPPTAKSSGSIHSLAPSASASASASVSAAGTTPDLIVSNSSKVASSEAFLDDSHRIKDSSTSPSTTTAASASTTAAKNGLAAASTSRRRRSDKDKVTVDDFEMIRVLGKGCAGKVLLVRHSPTRGLFAMKAIHKRHVLAHQELQHTLTEQAVLKRMAKEVMDPFVVKLWWSFHDKENLYLVMDFHPGGDLATQLSRWGRLGRDRARFYAAEIVEGVEGLHKAGVIYRDLKPENILIGNDGHIVLSDFGLSKEFPDRGYPDDRAGGAAGGSATPPPTSPRSRSIKDLTKGRSPHWMTASEDGSAAGGSPARRGSAQQFGSSHWADERDMTTTFCGTAEYLAPEVIQGSAYSYEVDWWSFGTMLFEMLTGITPFWADTHADMYVRVLHDDLVFPDDRVLDHDTKSILRGLLQRNPMLRMKEPRIKKHPYFSMIEWAHVFHKRYIPPYVPPINPLDETDTQNFDEAFLDMQPTVRDGVNESDDEEGDSKGDAQGSRVNLSNKSSNGTNAAKAAKANAASAASASGSDAASLFDGYSFRGRRDSESVHSAILSEDSRDEKGAAASDEEDEDAAARAAVAALDHLEREASGDGVTSAASITSSLPTTSGGARTSGSSDDRQLSTPPSANTSSSSSGAPTSNLPSRVGAPAHEAIAETDDEEDEDWDLVDGDPTALQSEMNGGKGANLFARGVVDTYRLLRRQDSSRLPLMTNSASGSSAAGTVGTGPFGKKASKRIRTDGAGSTLGGPRRPSSTRNATAGTLTSDSAASLDSTTLDPDFKTPPSSTDYGQESSMDGGEKRRKRAMKRFTTFFESATR